MADAEHPRLILHNYLSLDICKELEFIHKSCSTIGYRPNVFSTTLSHLIATNSAHFIMPFVPIRERLKEKVEEFFGCEFELFIEFTGLISWTRGASIGWHSDDNRPYLKQREFAVVCYLNSYGVDFRGGLFHFQDGEPTTISPMAGDVVMYTADSRNIHSVDEITDGERLTLTLWFSRDGSHDEDAKLISFLSQGSLNSLDINLESYLPLPASNNMYWFPPDQASNYQSGFDIRCARIHVLGYDLYSSRDKICFSAVDLSNDLSELLIEPLQLARGDELFHKEFANILHALQVVQFYYWKGAELQTSEGKRETNNPVPISQSQLDKNYGLKLVFVKDHQLAEAIFGQLCSGNMHMLFDWASFLAAVAAWEAYTCKLRQELRTSLPYWRANQSIFPYPSVGIEEGI